MADVLVHDGVVARIGAGDGGRRRTTNFDVSGCIVSPGFVDLAHTPAEPGFEQKGTIATETLAALRGGFTTVLRNAEHASRAGFSAGD